MDVFLKLVQDNLVAMVSMGIPVVGTLLYALNRFMSRRRKPSEPSQGYFPSAGGPE